MNIQKEALLRKMGEVDTANHQYHHFPPLIWILYQGDHAGEKPAPPLENWGKLFVDRLKLFVVGIIYFIPVFVSYSDLFFPYFPRYLDGRAQHHVVGDWCSHPQHHCGHRNRHRGDSD